MTTDREILETVARTLDEHTTDDWTGPLDAALEEMGLELGDSPDGSDPWHLATLADGRTIYLVDESARGWRRYSLA